MAKPAQPASSKGAARPAASKSAAAKPPPARKEPAGGGKPAARPALKPEADGYVPFSQRLAAWWHGEPVGPRIVRDQTDRRQVDISVESELVQLTRWSEMGVDIAGRLWGPGFTEPGGTAYWEEILIPAGPNGAMTILALGHGLGGGIRHMVRKLDLWLTAQEEDPELMAAGERFNDQAGLHQRILLKQDEYANIELPDSSHDLIFGREIFYRLADKERVLNRLTRALKPGGHLVFTDLVVEGKDRQSPQIAAWQEAEPGAAECWSEAQYRKALDDGTKMDLHVLKDDSERYNDFILQGWQALQESLDSAATSRQFVDLLMREGNIWLSRSRALQAGRLRLVRIHARHKKPRQAGRK